MRLYQSIYETALRNQVPRPLIDDLIRIYSYDVDFQRKVQPGDSFEMLFAGEDENGTTARREVLFASLTTGGETKKFYRYQIGRRRPRRLLRRDRQEREEVPRAQAGRRRASIRSGFGSRNHPLLRYTKMHTGVDWAAPMGTPIYRVRQRHRSRRSAGKAATASYIRIRHANGYETAYGHMSAFARNMEPRASSVRQGQVIGYVGSTGLSTGAHLHYEILINGRFVDPMKIKLPRGRVLEGALLASFDQERERLDNMITRGSPSRYADGNPPKR